MATRTVIYKCSRGAYHPWTFDGDCRDDDNRNSPEQYADENILDPDDIEVRPIDADENGVDGQQDETEDEDEDEDDKDEDDKDEDDGNGQGYSP